MQSDEATALTKIASRVEFVRVYTGDCCSGVGGHGWSADGIHWKYTLGAYSTDVHWANGTESTLYRRERPQPLVVQQQHQHPFKGGSVAAGGFRGDSAGQV